MSLQDLKPGDIGFLMHHDVWISKAIAWFMKSKWSHTFIIIEKGKFATFTSETCDFIVHTGELDKYLKDPNVSMEIFSPDITNAMREKIVKRCMQNHGELYGYLQLFSFAIRSLLKRIGIKIKNFIRQGMVCNQHALYGYTLTDIPGISGIDPESIETEETYKLVLGSNRFKKIFEKKKGEVIE